MFPTASAAGVWNRIEQTLEQMADVIKDLLLDGSLDANTPALLIEPLPPMPRERFIEAMRPAVEATLRRAADVINRAPTGRIVAASEERVGEGFAALWREALEVGVRLRLEAAEAQLPPGERPQGEWAKRFRRMAASR
jgi:hypothetical protein